MPKMGVKNQIFWVRGGKFSLRRSTAALSYAVLAPPPPPPAPETAAAADPNVGQHIALTHGHPFQAVGGVSQPKRSNPGAPPAAPVTLQSAPKTGAGAIPPRDVCGAPRCARFDVYM